MAERVILDLQAYCKILLHVFKYPHLAVNGLLLTRKSKNKENKSIQVVDAVPLFHVTLGLAPMMEVALFQVDSYCKSNDLVIAGYYQANESFKHNSPDLIACRITEKIADNYGEAFLLMVENDKLSNETDNAAFTVYSVQDGKAKRREFDKIQVEGGKGHAVASALLSAKDHWNFVDFDNHLDDISLDWTNPDVAARLKTVV